MDDLSAGAAPAAGPPPIQMRVLLVDDQAMVGEAIRRMLSAQPDLAFHYASEPEQALAMARALRPTVILQDLVMPGADGFDLIARYRADPLLRAIPVLVLSAREDPQLRAHSFAVGASDYLVKLPDRIELVARIRYHSAACISRIERDQAFAALRESEQKLAAANVELERLAARALYAAKRVADAAGPQDEAQPETNQPVESINQPRRKQAMSTQFDQVSVVKKSNIYFDGKCVSHGIVLADGTKKTIGVIFPSSLTFNTGAPEIMELVSGKCKVRLAGATEWNTYEGGQQFSVGANSSFDIETIETLDYVCHFG